jgi:ribosomal protein S18 acetylase RimI-like enzyme
MTLRISEASSDEIPLVYEIMQAAFAEYMGVLDPPSGVHAETLEDTKLAVSRGGALLAWLDDQSVGSVRYAFHDESCYIGRVSVLPGFRGQGIASAMVERIEKIAREHECKWLEVTVRMIIETNLRLYERIGFSIDRVYDHPKGGGMVADMVKPLTPEATTT